MNLFECCLTVMAEIDPFLIQVFHISAGTHDTDRVITVYQTKHMSEFMDYNLAESLCQLPVVGIKPIQLISESVQGGNPCITI